MLLLLVGVVFGEPCHDSALRACSCGRREFEREQMYVVNCTSVGFTSADALARLPAETQVLVWTGNHVALLPWNVFGGAENLTIIDLSDNGLREIKGKSFHHVSRVRRLLLDHNELSVGDARAHHRRVFSNLGALRELHLTDAFEDGADAGTLASDLADIFAGSNLTQLYKLHLEQNELAHLGDGRLLCSLPALRDIYLADNRLESAAPFNLGCAPALRFIDLERNRIRTVASGDLDRLDAAQRRSRQPLVLDLSANPLECGEGARVLTSWLRRTNVTVRNRELLECRSLGHRLRLLDVPFAGDGVTSSAGAWTAALLVLGAVVTLVAAVCVRRHRILDAVSRKVQYTTIESQDV